MSGWCRPGCQRKSIVRHQLKTQWHDRSSMADGWKNFARLRAVEIPKTNNVVFAKSGERVAVGPKATNISAPSIGLDWPISLLGHLPKMNRAVAVTCG